MSLPKGCVDWLVGTSWQVNKIPRIVSACCSQSHQERHFLCVYLFFWWYDGSEVSDSEGALWNGRDGQGGKDFNSWDGTVTVSWWLLELSVELCCVLPWSTDTFPPSSSRLGTHGTQHFCPTAQVFTHTQHNTKTGSVQGFGQKQVWKYFCQYFYEINTVLRQYLRA